MKIFNTDKSFSNFECGCGNDDALSALRNDGCGCSRTCGGIRNCSNSCNNSCNNGCNNSCNRPCNCNCRPTFPPRPCPCPRPPCPHPHPKKDFLSSYAEGVGNAQTVAIGGDVVFADTDIEGTDIIIDDDKKVFTILTEGLYSVEWSVNVTSANALLGILENGEIASAMYHSDSIGNIASGSLVKVDTVPFTISLRSFASEIALDNPTAYENTSASIRILRFADGAKSIDD